MTEIDPIIAVKNVEASAKWYEAVFGYSRKHGGDVFAVLVDRNDKIMLCLHKWGAHEHPTMVNPNIKPGNGLILYFRTESMEEVRKNVERIKHPVDEEIHVNPSSTKKEFSLRDLDGYYLTITEFHRYNG
ncbi:VOC family protein [Flagellimonas meridianipacifica]|uniref:Glyoxalase/fosfomycin resistance/dioxygenase domain-containing protein n=1 Tax=Flagellimonas meridianipacifica TaxID=1080225 RepID=A0A2T0M9N8_9FLAO|nr:VOC family protein [Allomuricauda pacifica]PRX54246.1 hypothetical protein CLV81_2644 [Allomuricauda pacifica]